MHRIISIPGDDSDKNVALIEQPSAPILFLTSAQTDIASLSSVINSDQGSALFDRIRALSINDLKHPAQIDHYLASTASKAEIVIIRLLGNKSYWSYGLEQFQIWQEQIKSRHLIVLSGTTDHELELNTISNIPLFVTKTLGKLLRIGGYKNILTFLNTINLILDNNFDPSISIPVDVVSDPYLWKWNSHPGEKIGVIFYLSTLQSGHTLVPDSIYNQLIASGLNPRIIFISSLTNQNVQDSILKLFLNESVSAVITATSFSSVKNINSYSSELIWDKLKVPVFQVLTSSNSTINWTEHSRGLDPIDLSLQIVLPEIDGRITTRIIAFREIIEKDNFLSTSIYKYEPDIQAIKWTCNHIKKWVDLQNLNNSDKKVCLIIANYPVKDGRIANGVGLNTPESVLNILKWLRTNNYCISNEQIPGNSRELIDELIKGRTNSLETQFNEPLDYITLEQYLDYYKTIPKNSRIKIEEKWNKPEYSCELEANGFPIHGISIENIAILIQPSRGYTYDNLTDIHSPYLPPTHRYIAQYLWIQKVFKSHAVMHIGKHGTVEWLPGKSVGLSRECFPTLTLPSLPHIYPFIVNDPGEGSQAKRRSHAVIIDHMIPPISRSGLYNEMLEIESLLDEYYESKLINPSRSKYLQSYIIKLITDESFTQLDSFKNSIINEKVSKDELISNIDSYLCEIKNNQIRSGLHIFGQDDSLNDSIETIKMIANAPSIDQPGLIRTYSQYLGFHFDPWAGPIDHSPSCDDSDIFFRLEGHKPRINSVIVDYLEKKCSNIVFILINTEFFNNISDNNTDTVITNFIDLNKKSHSSNIIKDLINNIIPSFFLSSKNEKKSLLEALNGVRIASGPSGSPTRGRIDVLPTGRNFYSIDLRSIPTQLAWDLGVKTANKIIELHELETGEYLRKMALSVWGTSTMRNGGEDIAQMLALMGVKPVWDYSSKAVIDLEIIPYSILQRPRVDVTLRISGFFRDAFPQLINLVNKAISLISRLDEDSFINPLSHTLKQGKSIGRIYGSAPETYGTGIQELINTGNWESNDDLASTFIDWSKWLYKDSKEPIEDKQGLLDALKSVQVVMHNQDNKEHDILDSDDYYQFHGGLASSIKSITGTSPKIYFGDNSRQQRPLIHGLQKEIDKVVRSRLLNPLWINGMRNHSYKGAFEMAASLDYLFAYDATTGSVPDWCYSGIFNKWLDDNHTREFLEEANPWALRDIAERLLEASNRGLWQNWTETKIDKIKSIIISSEGMIESKN